MGRTLLRTYTINLSIPSNCSLSPSPLSAPCFSWCALLPHHSPGLVQPRLLSAPTLATTFIPCFFSSPLSQLANRSAEIALISFASTLQSSHHCCPLPSSVSFPFRETTPGPNNRNATTWPASIFLHDTYLHIKTHLHDLLEKPLR
jgi:hypothetical protein